NFLEKIGAEGVYIDEALNVVFPVNAEGKNEMTVIAAHTDTVFPDTEPMPYSEDEEKIYCPGVGDNTVRVVMLLLLAKFIVENKLTPKNGMLLVCNSCEEGLGNLKGVRRLFKDYEGRISGFITLDNNYPAISDRTAGSHRYEVEVKTRGGHSYQAFGNTNANAVLAEMITKIYKLSVPEKEGAKTTYNVGIISGGTSVNTICQSAKMLCEYRSNDRECLAVMKEHFERIFKEAKNNPDTEIIVEQVGDRPCSDIAPERLEAFKTVVAPVIESVVGMPVEYKCSSTDCNIPMSLGIPGLNVGTNISGGSHTREEYLVKNSVPTGIEIALRLGIRLAEI
ncbi:MAG: M20/M25/M40 family metallo-hydrolase, partial [Oscillospiraceae bacterium]|nr:M20/M25/M40 family metallo-hydrolase [Oscillospiraceae bacterium]